MINIYDTLKTCGNTVVNTVKEVTNNCSLLNAVHACMTPSLIRKKSNRLLFDDSRFYRINLNGRGRTHHSYVNIEEQRTSGKAFVSPLQRLPFDDHTVKIIFVDFGTFQKSREQLAAIFKEWGRIIVPNGVLTMDNCIPDDAVMGLLDECGFKKVFHESQKYVPVIHFVYSPADNFYPARKMYYKEVDGCLVVSSQAGDETRECMVEDIPWGKKQLTEISLFFVLEYVRPALLEDFLVSVCDHLMPDGRVHLSIANELFMRDGHYISFFDKINFAQYIHETGFAFDKIELDGDTIRAIVRKKTSLQPPLSIKRARKKRVSILGQYLMFRYIHLGLDWDGIVHAMEELGWEYQLLEGLRNLDYETVRKAIISYKPEYIFTMLKEMLPFLVYMKEDLKRLGIKTIFWYCDPDTPWQMDLRGVLDYMFLSNNGQLDDYKKALNIDNVYFMTQCISPYIMYRHNVPEIYDIGFLGAVTKESLHNTRRRALQLLHERYRIGTRKNIRNNVSEFYSQSKIVFGGSDFSYDLYTSNRFWVALGCGAPYLTYKFPGIERLARNREHVLWFENESELLDIADYYLKHDNERKRIGENAARLTRERHTYAHRLKNIFDIVDGKTDQFYGFL